MASSKAKRSGLTNNNSNNNSGFTALPPIDLGWKDKAEAMVGSLVNVEHVPGGGNKPIPRKRLRWEAEAKVGSLDNVHYYKEMRRSSTSHSDPVVATSKRRVSSMLEASARYGPLAKCGAFGTNLEGGGGVGEDTFSKQQHRRRYQNVRPRVGSLENIAHVPGGGEMAIQHHRTRWKAEPRVGSLDNVRHVPGGGEVGIEHRRLSWQAKPRVGSLDNIGHVPRLKPITIPRNRTTWEGRARVGSLENIHHQPGGGLVTIHNKKNLRWNAQAKVGSNPPATRRKNSSGHVGSSFESLNSSTMARIE
ncbi:uncharacterized protein LOC143290076 [Babylonia areolata]|uniref:uncharacterized protein LOC143290076 n=1 Tax=Babylonia areolata TaxID=304850 RepID=UPI003FD1BD18